MSDSSLNSFLNLSDARVNTKSNTKILLSAFACEPGAGSESYVGWNWATRLHNVYNVTVLTRKYSENIIRAHEATNDIELISFDLPGCSNKGHYWRFIKPYYVIWQFCVFFYIFFLQFSKKFEVIHHLTYNVVDVPGFLWLIPGAKFIWGPVGGGQVPPKELKRVYGANWYKQRLRAMLKLSSKFNPIVVGAAISSAHIFFANKETAKLLSHCGARRSMMLETAIDPGPLKVHERNKIFTIFWLGNVIERKALNLAIDGFKAYLDQGSNTRCKLIIGGDGPLLGAAKSHVDQLGIGQYIEFLGRIPYEEVLINMDSCDAFLFTSAQDTSGNVVLEAMSRGRPVISLDHQGVSEIISKESAIAVPIGPYEEIVRHIGLAIGKLAHDESLLQRLSSGAYINIVENHKWSNRLAHYKEIITKALNN